MPPKKSDKAAKAAKAKSVEDKTFGLKNKNKSSKVQKYVQQVQQAAGQTAKKKPELTKKELEERKRAELELISNPIIAPQKVPFGVDPKTVVCQYFKQGVCTKGNKCKFSHDLASERKSGKIDLYTDARQADDAKLEDTMDKWDQAKLEQVVATKQDPKQSAQTTTDIVCKFFIQAVEDSKYGWFWMCPNGPTCKYRHALPPGFVLNGNKKKVEEEVQTLEEWIEEAKKNMPKKLTPVTLESFTKWKADRQAKQEKDEADRLRAREAAVRAGKSIGASGRELFTFNPDMYNMEDDAEAWDGDYKQRDEDEAQQQQQQTAQIDESAFAADQLGDLGLDDDEDDDDADDDSDEDANDVGPSSRQ